MLKQILSLIIVGQTLCSWSKSTSGVGEEEHKAGRSTYEKLGTVVDSFALPQAFFSITTKVKVDPIRGDIYGLVQQNDGKKITTILVKVDRDTKATLEVARSNADDLIIDFDVRDGEVVYLNSQIASIANNNFELPYRQLKITRMGRTAATVTFFDRNQSKAIVYDKDENTRPVQLPDDARTLFLVGHETIQFARLMILSTGILLTTTGVTGEKAFLLDLQSLAVIWDKVVSPRTDYRDERLYAEAPLVVSEDSDFISIASKVLREETKIISKYLLASLPVAFSSRQGVLLQRLDMKGDVVESNAYLFADYLSLTSLQTKNGHRFVLADVTSQDGWKGSILNVSVSGSIQWKKVFSPYGESSFGEMVVVENQIFVGGKCGFRQVSTGSVVEFADACLLTLDMNGKLTGSKFFGTDRNDAIVSMSPLGDRFIVGGFVDGPITHTADQDQSAGHQSALFGVLK